jgi:hypothetical protein
MFFSHLFNYVSTMYRIKGDGKENAFSTVLGLFSWFSHMFHIISDGDVLRRLANEAVKGGWGVCNVRVCLWGMFWGVRCTDVDRVSSVCIGIV